MPCKILEKRRSQSQIQSPKCYGGVSSLRQRETSKMSLMYTSVIVWSWGERWRSWLRHCARLRLECDGTSAETRFRFSAKRTSPFKSAGASVHSTTGSRGVPISDSNAEYTMFRGSVKGTVYPLHSSVSPSLPLPCVAVYHHVATGLYNPQGRGFDSRWCH